MKILIIGKNSYIGQSFKHWMTNNHTDAQIDEISIRDDNWKSMSFSNYDCIIHLAALVHENERKHTYEDYFKTNVLLTKELAEKSIKDEIPYFMFFSTMAVFGNARRINESTLIKPVTKYGKSKKAAEDILLNIFKRKKSKLSIIRPPMVYGVNAKGNPNKFQKLANLLPFFPKVNNKRSFISIDCLVKVMNEMILQERTGIVHPMDEQYMTTFELFSKYRNYIGKKAIPLNVTGKLIKFFLWIPILNKMFGDLYYDFQKKDNH
jgi:UDP-glucose 4-epimerase